MAVYPWSQNKCLYLGHYSGIQGEETNGYYTLGMCKLYSNVILFKTTM